MKSRGARVFVLVFIQSFLILLASQTVWARDIVETNRGWVRGQGRNGYYAFLGIPYAKARRWEAPRPYPKWDGVLNAFSFGPPCMQKELGRNRVIGSEDCQYLNIWVPKNAGPEKLPVMVWVHGGAFILGSGNQAMGPLSLYDGARLVEEGQVIMVTLNYRLGPLGFFSHPNLSALVRAQALKSIRGTAGPYQFEGNFALLDLFAALKWLKINIGEFGGDWQKTTLFGESAGASLTYSSVASPLAKNLFSGAIAQSGVLLDLSMQEAQAIGGEIAYRAGYDRGLLSAEEWQEFYETPAEQLILDNPMMTQPDKNGLMVRYAPVVDGRVLVRTVLETFLRGEHNRVPMILGSNKDEVGHLLGTMFLRDVKPKTQNELQDFIEIHSGPKVAQFASEIYTAENFGSLDQAGKAFMSDYSFHAPVLMLAEAINRYDPGSAWVYRYSKGFLGKAEHAVELIHFWGPKFMQSSIAFPPNWLGFLTPGEKSFIKQFRKWWFDFAHHRTPNMWQGDSKVAPPYWPDFTTGYVLNIKSSPEVQPFETLGNSRRVWELTQLMKPPQPRSRKQSATNECVVALSQSS